VRVVSWKIITFAIDDVVSEHAYYLKVVTLHCVEGWEVTIYSQIVVNVASRSIRKATATTTTTQIGLDA
jgi:hypothetical protein